MDNRYLFRGKRTDTGEWVDGHLITDEKDDSKCFIGYIMGTDEDGTSHDLDVVQVDSTTICQCTGLEDKNGKLIWENDILMCHGKSEDLVKAVFGEFNVINAETPEVIDRVIGWHYEVVPTDALSKCEPFCLPMPLTEEYVKRCDMEVVDDPECFGVSCFQNGNS